jgi:hypothetical protein
MYNQWLLPKFFDNSHNTQKIDVDNLWESPKKRAITGQHWCELWTI